MNFIRSIIATAVLSFPTAVLADTFVLVHGAFQDASSWNAVSKFIEAKGHEVIAVNLPGRDATGDAAKAISLNMYIDTITKAVSDADEPVILVGHSFGGMTVTTVADRMPNAIAKLIYVAAYVPQSGESMEKLAVTDKDNRFTPATFVIAKDYSHAEILAEDQSRVFAQDATASEAIQLKASMIREPLAPIGTPVEFEGKGFAKVTKAYIRTLDDGTVSTPLQTMMIERAGIKEVRDINTGHAPFLTQPKMLGETLVELGEK